MGHPRQAVFGQSYLSSGSLTWRFQGAASETSFNTHSLLGLGQVAFLHLFVSTSMKHDR